MQRRDVLHSPRLVELKRKRRKLLMKKILFWVIFILLFTIPVAYISRMDKLNISAVEVRGNRVIDSRDIREVAQGELSGNYLWVFPKTNLFIYPKRAIFRTLETKYKRLTDISLEIENRKTLIIKVEERTPGYTWCGFAPSPTPITEEKCFFLDESGYIFDTAPYFSGGVYFKFYGNTEHNDGDPTGTHFFGANFHKLTLLKDALISMGLKPIYAYVDNTNLKISLEPGANAPSTPELYLKTNADFAKMAENLETALSTEPLLSDFKKKYSSLLYIDLRYGNKVFYKFR